MPRSTIERTWRTRWERIAEDAHRMIALGPELIELSCLRAATPSGSPAGRRSEHADPTATQATADPPSDIVAGWLADLLALSRDTAATASRCALLAHLVEHRADQRVGRQPTGGDCLACDRWVAGTTVDRLRSGYCESCYKAYRRWAEHRQDASHVAFRLWRRRQLDQMRSRSALAGLGLGA